MTTLSSINKTIVKASALGRLQKIVDSYFISKKQSKMQNRTNIRTYDEKKNS